MTTVPRALLLSLLLLATSAAPARAAGLIAFVDWLDHLSGPGPFLGIGAEATLVCDDGAKIVVFKCISFKRPPDENVPRRFEGGVHGSVFFGFINDDLVYDSQAPNGRRVNAQTYGVHTNLWVTQGRLPRLGATVRLTAARLSGDVVPGGSLTNAMVGLGPILRLPFVGRLRLDVVPLAQLGLGPFEPSDFGALGPGLGSDAVKLNLQARVVF